MGGLSWDQVEALIPLLQGLRGLFGKLWCSWCCHLHWMTRVVRVPQGSGADPGYLISLAEGRLIPSTCVHWFVCFIYLEDVPTLTFCFVYEEAFQTLAVSKLKSHLWSPSKQINLSCSGKLCRMETHVIIQEEGGLQHAVSRQP